METKTTKITAIILTLVMLVTMLGAFSLTASAAETVVAWKDTDNDGIRDSGEATYTNLSTALSAGGTVKLTADYTLGNNATAEQYISMSSGTATLDLNGHTLICASLIKEEIIVLSGTADLTITDSKTTGVMNCQSRSDVQLSDSAKLTIAGGIIQTDTVHTQYYLSINKSGNAVFQITGGKHYSNPTEYVAANHKVTIGEISNTEPRYTVSKIEMNDVVAWNDADNDGVIDSGEQVFSDMDTALAAGVDLKMNSDIFRNSRSSPPGSLKITSTTTIDLNGYSIVASAYCFQVTGGTLTIKDSAGGGQLWCQDDEKYAAIAVSYGDNIGLTVESGTILGGIVHYGESRYPDAVVLSGGNYNFDPSKYINDSTLTAGQDSSGLWGIRPKAENACAVTIGGAYFYTGEAITPTIVVTDLSNSEILTEGVDYTVSLSDNVNVGTATATVTFINDYRGSITETFAIGCDHSCSAHTTATNNGNGTHNFTCTVCGNIGSEQHTFTTDTCICGAQAAASLTTADATPVVTYYETLEEAITAAQNADGSKVTLLDDCLPKKRNWFQIDSGTFTIDLNGKSMGSSIYSTLVVKGGTITLEDSVGTGVIEQQVSLEVGHLTIKGGNYEKDVRLLDGELVIAGGDFTCVRMLDGALTLSGGTMDLLQIKDGHSTMADILLTGHHYYDANGSVVDISDLPPTLHGYDLANVIVKKGADLSADAAITVAYTSYNGTEQEPQVTVIVGGVELVRGVDYLVSYPSDYDFINVGMSEITIEGLGNYTGSATATYIIQKGTLTTADITLSGLNANYDRNPHPVAVATKPTGLEDNCITIIYMKDGVPLESAPTNAGAYTVQVYVNNSPNYAYAVLEYKQVIAPAAVTVEIAEIGAEFFYTGYPHTPQVVITWNGGIPFYPEELGGTVNYTNNTAVGNATATVGGNFTGSVIFEIQKGKPTITLESPLDRVMPGYVLELTPRTTALDQFFDPPTFTILDGEGYSVSGNIITIDEGVLIGSAITVKVTSTETGNYQAAQGELTLTIGVPTVDTAALEAEIDELEEKIAALEQTHGADVTGLQGQIDTLRQLIAALGDTYATDQELADAIAAVNTTISALTQRVADLENTYVTKTALENAVEALEKAIADGDAADAQALEDAVDALEKAIADAVAALEKADADNRAALETVIGEAKVALQTAIDELEKRVAQNENDIAQLQADLKQAIEDLNKAIADGDAADARALEEAVAALEQKLANAIASLEELDQNNRTALEALISDAQAALEAAIAELENRISQNETDIDALRAELAAKYAELKDLIESNDSDISKINDTLQSIHSLLDTLATKTDVEAEVAVLTALIDELAARVAANEGNINANINAISALRNTLSSLETRVAAQDEALAQSISALSAALTDLEIRVAANEQAITALQNALKQAVEELNAAIAAGDTANAEALAQAVDTLEKAIADAVAALEQADADNKAALEAMITQAQTALQNAIDQLTKDLEEAEKELSDAISSGDEALDEKITKLNAALNNAIAAYQAADSALRNELIAKINSVSSSLRSAINQVASDLSKAEKELSNAIAAGDVSLDEKIAALSAALEDAIAACQAADGAMKEELTAKIDQADAALQAAIDKVNADLTAARQALQDAIAAGDADLSQKIEALSAALENAVAAMNAADKMLQTKLDQAVGTLENAITSGDETLRGEMSQAVEALEKAIAQVQKNLDNAKAELKANDDQLTAEMKRMNTVIIVVAVAAGLGLCGSGALLVLLFLDKRRKTS